MRQLKIMLMIACCLLISVAFAYDHAQWSRNNVNSVDIIDHGMWSDFLTRYATEDDVSHDVQVHYGSVRPIDYKRLNYYIEFLQKQRLYDLNQNEQKAFWINLYNALTVQLILDHYPCHTVRDINISPQQFKRGPWGAKLVEVEHVPLSLDDISYILRATYHDNRILYALNNGSRGAPRLAPYSYEGRKLDEQLDVAADYFVNGRGVKFDSHGVIISQMYYWYPEEFNGTDVGILEHLALFAKKPLRDKLKVYRSHLAYTYDWSLNGE